ncbi:MAG: ComEC/Rec2 family competence protein [Chthoniobacterales bacterium]
MKVGEAAVRQPFLGIAAAALLGITAADSLPWPWLSGSLLVATAAASFVLRRNGIAGLIVVAILFFALHNWRQASSPGVRLARELGEAGQAIVARGEVMSEPTTSASGTDSFLLRLESITRGSVTQHTHATVRAYWRGAVQFGDRLQLFGVAEPIGPPRNPGEFDYRTYLRRRDIHHSLVVRSPENGKLLARGGGNSILHAAHKSRRWIHAALARGLEDSPEVARAPSPVMVGTRSLIKLAAGR